VFDLSRVARWQNQKRAAVLAFVAASCTLLLCSLILSVPSLDDALTGRPEYLRWITDRTARTVAARTNGEFPVIARHDDAYDCDKIGNMSAGDSNDILYVFTYSETSRSLCFVTYQRARESATQSRSEVLSSNSSQNYGRQVSTPIAAVPVGHLSIKFPESYLTLLHWKTHVDAALLARAGNAQLRPAMPPSMSVLPVDVSLQLAELREVVAQRHNTVNAVLLSLSLISVLCLLLSAAAGLVLYRRVRPECARCGMVLGFATSIREDLCAVGERARTMYRCAQETSAEELRRATALQQARETLKERLQSFLEVADSEPQRLRIRDCLERTDLEDMRNVLSDVESYFRHAGPEQRILMLLESLKEFCGDEEFDGYRIEAFEILRALGFREARTFVVRMHHELRSCGKLLELEPIETSFRRTGTEGGHAH
jgi:hypothetical protein